MKKLLLFSIFILNFISCSVASELSLQKIKDDLSSPCCDVYSTRVLELINKKPSDWPSPSGYKVCNTPNYTDNM